MVTPKAIAVASVFIASLFLTTAFAGATGTVMIRQNDGRVNVYKQVSIKVLHGALFLTSRDGKGTLVIHRAACSYQGKLLVCFATSASLVQAGKTSPLDLKTGTVYLNSTDAPQPLVLSSTKVPPHSIMLTLSTDRGTYIASDGRIDKVVK